MVGFCTESVGNGLQVCIENVNHCLAGMAESSHKKSPAGSQQEFITQHSLSHRGCMVWKASCALLSPSSVEAALCHVRQL